jgi:Phytoene dehydrogenase and related proteins
LSFLCEAAEAIIEQRELSAFVSARSLAFCALGATEKFSVSADYAASLRRHHHRRGHNGLTCACYLARAGLKVLVLEQYHTVGGMTVTEEETLPGFWSDIHASGYQLANLSPVPNELGFA